MPWRERQGEILLASLYLSIIIQLAIAAMPHVAVFIVKLVKNKNDLSAHIKAYSTDKIIHTYNFYESKFFILFLYTFVPTYLLTLTTCLYYIDSVFFALYYALFPLCFPFILYFSFLYIKSLTSHIYITETKFIVYSRLSDKITISIPLDNIVDLTARHSIRGSLYIAYINLKKGKRITLYGLSGWDVVQLNQEIANIRSSSTCSNQTPSPASP